MGIWDALVGGVASLAGSGIQAYSQQKTNEMNEALMRESWRRDDTAVQRRKADLEAAGLNPVLAAGDAASNSGAIKLEPLVDDNIGNQAVQAANAAVNIAQTQAQTDLTAAQARKANVEADLMENTKPWHMSMDQTVLDIGSYKQWAEWVETKARSEEAFVREPIRTKTLQAQLDLVKSDVSLREKQTAVQEVERQLKELGVKYYEWDKPWRLIGKAARAPATPKRGAVTEEEGASEEALEKLKWRSVK